MKTTLTSILLLFTSALFGQIPENTISIEDEAFDNFFLNKKDLPTVKGKILNLSAEDKENLVIEYKIVTPFAQKYTGKRCELTTDNKFELELEFPFPYQQIWITIGDLYYAVVYANTDLFVQLDANLLKKQGGVNYIGQGVQYLGSDGALNDYLNNHQIFKKKEHEELYQSLHSLKRNRGLDLENFLTKYDSVYSIINSFDQEFIKQNSSNFSWIIKNNRLSDYYGLICIKSFGKEMEPALFEKIKRHKSYLTSHAGMRFYNYLFSYLSEKSRRSYKVDYSNFRTYSKLNQNEERLLDSLHYLNKRKASNLPYDTNLFDLYRQEANQFLRDTIMIEKDLQLIAMLDSLFDDPKSDFLKIKISSKDPSEHELKLKTLLTHTKSDWCRHIIQLGYEKNLQKQSKINAVLTASRLSIIDDHLGKPIMEMPFGAKLFNADSIEAEDLLSNLKKAFDGKALLIDFWATWCSPCLKEMPYSRALQNQAKDLPIQFIYLCTSQRSSMQKWQSKIAELELSGTHIYVEKSIENELMNLFSVNGFPSYVFVTTKGKYKAGVIDRISHMNIVELKELLKK